MCFICSVKIHFTFLIQTRELLQLGFLLCLGEARMRKVNDAEGRLRAVCAVNYAFQVLEYHCHKMDSKLTVHIY